MSKARPTIAELLDSATVGSSPSKIQQLLDSDVLTAKDAEAIIAARKRGIGYRRIGEILTAGLQAHGHDIVIGDSAVQRWLASQGVK